jgi:MoaD family protein
LKLEVMYFGKLRDLAGGTTKEMVDVVEDIRLDELLEQFGERFGAGFTKNLHEIRDLRILINGREYHLLGGMTTKLKEGDKVVLLPPVFGG